MKKLHSILILLILTISCGENVSSPKTSVKKGIVQIEDTKEDFKVKYSQRRVTSIFVKQWTQCRGL